MKQMIIFWILVCLSSPLKANEADQQHDQVTALFLYNFANFAEWPYDAFDTPTSPIKMCLFGELSFATYLEAVDGTLIGDRELNVYRTTQLDNIKKGCHLLFVSEKMKAKFPKFWQQVSPIYVLSVGEQDQFAERGGVINIMRASDQLEFDINISNALEAGLFLSSELLSLAREIKRNTQ